MSIVETHPPIPQDDAVPYPEGWQDNPEFVEQPSPYRKPVLTVAGTGLALVGAVLYGQHNPTAIDGTPVGITQAGVSAQQPEGPAAAPAEPKAQGTRNLCTFIPADVLAQAMQMGGLPNAKAKCETYATAGAGEAPTAYAKWSYDSLDGTADSTLVDFFEISVARDVLPDGTSRFDNLAAMFPTAKSGKVGQFDSKFVVLPGEFARTTVRLPGEHGMMVVSLATRLDTKIVSMKDPAVQQGIQDAEATAIPQLVPRLPEVKKS